MATAHRPQIVLQAPVRDTLSWLAFDSPREILQASTIDQVRPVLRRAEEAADDGMIAAGFVSYEAAPAFDSALAVQRPDSLPLAWFGVYREATTLDGLPPASGTVGELSWQASVTAAEYRHGLDAILRHIGSGNTYQVNFTLRLATEFAADPWQLFVDMCRGQRSRCCAFVDTGDRLLCSASPELFFRLDGERIWSRPMKGTAARGRNVAEDSSQAQWLRSSDKNRAENLMIVDMVRNDLGRIASPDSVEVAELWQLEKYPSLFQLTSTVEGRTLASLEEIFTALFPCASVTGAPKVASMRLIRDLEKGPRGAYTGAIGMIGPGRRARFNVAIRTVDVDVVAGRATYGTGSGVVWDSVADDEWSECRTKALVLQPPPPQFEILETLRWDPDSGFLLLKRHLDRLESSAEYFDFSFVRRKIERALRDGTRNLPLRPHRIRLLLDRGGRIRLEVAALKQETRPWLLGVATEPVDSSDPFLFHKTTHRQVYQAHRTRFPEHDDVLLWNERGEITESTLANVVVRRQQRWLTPPAGCGLLAGTMRAQLLEQGEIEEELLTLEDLPHCDQIRLINSVRRWIDVELDRTALVESTETRPSETA